MATKLYVGNLSFNTTEEELRQAFAAFGAVSSCNVIMDRMTLWDAAASTPALTVIFFGTVLTVPVILAYTALY